MFAKCHLSEWNLEAYHNRIVVARDSDVERERVTER